MPEELWTCGRSYCEKDGMCLYCSEEDYYDRTIDDEACWRVLHNGEELTRGDLV